MSTETVVTLPLTRDEQIQKTANEQVSAILAHFQSQEDKKATNALVEKALKDRGFDIEAITIQAIVDDRMNQIKQRDNMRAANELAKRLYKEQTGNDFVDD